MNGNWKTFVGGFFAGTLLMAPTVQALTLKEVLAEVQAHPKIEQARQETKEAKAMGVVESWLPDPKAMIEFEEVPWDRPGLGNADMINYGISQEIPFPTTLIQRKRLWNAEVKSRQAMTTGTVRDVAFEAKKNYFELVANQNQLAAKESILNAYNRIITSLEARYQSSIASLVFQTQPAAGTSMGGSSPVMNDESGSNRSNLNDILMARMRKAEVEAEIHDLHHQHHSLEARLNLLMGRDAHASIGRLEQIPLKILKKNEHELHQIVLTQNSDIQAAKWQATKAGREVGLAAQSFIPTFEPEFQYNQREDQENAYTFGVRFNVPLWAHRNAAQIRSAKAGHRAAQAGLEAERRKTLTEFYYLVNHAKQHYKIVQKYQNQIVPLAKSAVNIDQVDLSASIISPVRILQNIIAYHDAINMYWVMWQDYQTEYAMLEQLVGEEL